MSVSLTVNASHRSEGAQPLVLILVSSPSSTATDDSKAKSHCISRIAAAAMAVASSTRGVFLLTLSHNEKISCAGKHEKLDLLTMRWTC